MSYKIKKADKAKIYRARPNGVAGIFSTNIITDNKTTADGNVVNKSPYNAVAAREWVDENDK